MQKTILVAGANGNLGMRIVKALVDEGAQVRALVRQSSANSKTKELEQLGTKVIHLDLLDTNDTEKLMESCSGVHCVVSALAGLENSIIDAQKILVDAAVSAGVSRFIPSDYSLDFTPLILGRNRNLDLRRTFHEYIKTTPIAATTIFNGAFADMLTGQMPLVLFKQKRILYWGNADQQMDFTSMDNTAAYTAKVALDNNTPRYLRIAGDRKTPRELQALMTDISGSHYKLFRPGGTVLLNALIKIARTVAPGKNELYPAWQGMQYMRDMVEGKVKIDQYQNDRYPTIKWTTAKDILSNYIDSTK
jgi:NAD(P)-dependent dehydrogenase (short-subunit alcohol dehydrogenase family)